MRTKGVIFGDSVAKGVIINEIDNRYSVADKTFAEICSKVLDMELMNYSRFGSTINVGNKIVNRHINQIKGSDYTFLEYGGNDCDYKWAEIAKAPKENHKPNTPLSEFSRIYSELIKEVRAQGSKPVLLTLPPLDSERYFNYFSKDFSEEGKYNILRWLGGKYETINSWHELYNLEIFKLGIKHQVKVIDITTAFLEKLCFSDYLCNDGIHPNEAGQELIAQSICQEGLAI